MDIIGRTFCKKAKLTDKTRDCVLSAMTAFDDRSK